MAATSEKTNPKLWDKVKRDVKARDKAGKPGQWSARKAQMAVQEYKSEGGGYKGGKSADSHLAQWTQENATKKQASKGGATRASLMREAAAKKIKGRSRMSKAQLEHALHPR